MTGPATIRWLHGAPYQWPLQDEAGPLAWIIHEADLPGLADLPPPTQGDLAEAARRPAWARTSALHRRRLLRHLVTLRFGQAAEAVTLETDRTGAPRLQGLAQPAFVSMASRGGWMALAIGPQLIGVDIEILDQAPEPAWNILSEEERAWLAGLLPQRRPQAFLRIWTGKEAYLKALGTGLSREPSCFTIRARSDGFEVRDRSAAKQIQGSFFEARDFVAACLMLDR